jgi:hypothetical protein
MQNNGRYFAIVSVLVIAAMAFMGSTVYAQVTTAALTGTVYDSSGAVVPSANVVLKNEASGDTRRTVSNADGYFTFAAVPPGSYSVTVDSKGFNNWQATGVVLNSGDKRNVFGVKLVPGAATETVRVEAAATSITPVDSGEKSTTINEHIMNNVAIVGQNAAEFIKIMPGMAFSGGTLNQSSYGASDERTGSGPVGSFSANGNRLGALDITSDGAHIIDPGCNCGQAMNTNADMTSELKVMSSNFGADEAKGPVVISAIGKSGGQQFHGELYTYNRYFAADATDPLNGSFGNFSNGQPIAPKAKTKYFYPGGNIGGPVIIPGSSFNRNHDKMFFFYGMEYYKQDVDNGVYESTVPTLHMRQGIFNDVSLHPATQDGCPDTNSANSGLPGFPYENCYIHFLNGGNSGNFPSGGNWTNGVLNPSAIDPNGLRLMNTYPLANVDPSIIVNGQKLGWNYINAQTRFSNMLQERARIDYNFSDSTKLYVSYNHQHDNAINSLDTLWTGTGQSWAAPTTPYPTPLVETTTSHVITANLTKVFSPSLTNELVFTYTYLNLPNSFQNPNKVSRTGLGLDYQLLFNHPNPGNLIFPQLTGWGDGISNMLNSGFELNGTVYAKKTLPSVADNVVKVWGTHTTKLGFYWERTWNSQPGNSDVNGQFQFAPWAGGSSSNPYGDMLQGTAASYDETNYNVVPAFRYLSEEFYGQDSWKISRRLTLDYGVRVSHLGPWSDTTGYGFGAWYPSLFKQTVGGVANGVDFPGIEWNKERSATPLSGSASRAFFYNPRVGFAWDIFGTGRTVLRGGYGMYRFHDEQNVQGGAYGVVRGSFDIGVGSQIVSNVSPALLANKGFSAPANITALDPTDSQEPRTQNYSFTVAERLPWKSTLEVAYVGSKSDYLSNYNNNFNKINNLAVGAMFTAPACGGSVCPWSPSGNYSPSEQNAARPYVATPAPCPHTFDNSTNPPTPIPCGYGTGLKIITHQMYSNYNSLQASWNKQAGHLTFMANYTYSKALGIRGENGSQTGDPTSLVHNYGTLPSNRTHIFNVAYVYELPTLANANKFVKGAVNGWQISGIVQYQTGSDLQAAVSNSYNFGYSGFIAPNTTFMGVNSNTACPQVTPPTNPPTYTNCYVPANNQNILGTADVTLMPVLTCNPSKGLKTHQYMNPNCFSGLETPDVQGSYIIPVGSGPGFFNTDLSVFKNFTFGANESKKLQFRFSGYNFINHPLYTFLKNDPNLTLKYALDNAGVPVLSSPNFGVTNNKTGHRILQGMIKFSF